jgi:release factor glutamine methyltransferase
VTAADLAAAAALLREAGIEQPRRETRWIAAHAGGDAALFASLIARRAAREPLAFLLGRQEFCTLELAVSPATLIPRADSETLIAAACATLPERAAVRRILDLGTGTGCLLLAALREYPRATGVGVDCVPQAVALAARNAAACGLRRRATFVCGDWASALVGGFDLLLCNPPYVESGAIAGLMPEVARFEPRSALDGGADGLAAYRRLLPEVARLLLPGGAAVFELGLGQAEAFTALARAAGLAPPVLHADLASIARAAVLRSPAG